MMLFETLSGKVTLYLMRDAWDRQIWRKRKFENFESWAHTRFSESGMSHDTIQRYCNVIEKMVAPLDAVPALVNGTPIDGLELITRANPTSLQKLSGHYMKGDDRTRDILLQGLTSGTSDYRQIKASAGWEPTIGKWEASFIQALDPQTGEIYWRGEFPRMSQEQMDYTYRILSSMIHATVKPHEHHTGN